jgi:hypothetical protein
MWQRALIGLVVVVVGCLPLVETLHKGSFLWRGDTDRTTRAQDPAGFWVLVVSTVLLALISLGVGIAISRGLLRL